MASSGITSRIVSIMEAFSFRADEGLTTQEIIQRSGLPASTVYRLIAEFEELGLLYKTADKRLHPNFRFERLLSFDTLSPERLTTACARISDTLEAASEIIVLQGHNLFWHVVRQHPMQAIRLRAHAGYVRETRELDSITRVALAHVPLAFIEKHWDTTAFHNVGVDHTPLTFDKVRERLAAVAPDGVEYDLEGNAKGVRRFAVAVRDGQRIACLLTVAEAATPMRDEAAHVERIRALLLAQRDWVEGGPTQEEQAATGAMHANA